MISAEFPKADGPLKDVLRLPDGACQVAGIVIGSAVDLEPISLGRLRRWQHLAVRLVLSSVQPPCHRPNEIGS